MLMLYFIMSRSISVLTRYAGTDSTQGAIVWETRIADCGIVISCREEVREEVKPLS